MKKIILLLFLVSGLFAQGRVASHPVWHGFQKVADDQLFNTTGSTTDVFKANEIYGVGTLWLEASSATSDVITCYLYIQNEKSGTQAMIDSVVFNGLNSGANPIKFGDHWTVADWAFFAIKTSSSTIELDVYVGTE